MDLVRGEYFHTLHETHIQSVLIFLKDATYR
jgi:hypothetical protein